METLQENQITFEELAQLDRDLANADFLQEQDVQSDLDISGKLKKICSIYKSVKPVLGIINSIPFIPGNVKSAVKAFANVLDSICA